MFKIYLTLVVVLCFSQQAMANKIGRDNSLKVACMIASELAGSEGDEQWCQCENDYYAELLTDEDWDKYTKDYYALVRKKNSTASTKANSYARKVQIGNSHCIRCKKESYKGCLVDDGATPTPQAYANIYQALQYGDFDKLSKNQLFKRFYVDFLYGYSAFCGQHLKNYTERTIVSTEWKNQNHIWWEGNTSISKVRIAKKHFVDFEKYEDELSSQTIADIYGDIIKSKRRGELPGAGANKIIAATINAVSFMRDIFSNSCNAENVGIAYDNLYNYNNGLSATINQSLAEQKQQQEREQTLKYADIVSATKSSRVKAIEIYAQQQKIEKAKIKTKMSCIESYKKSGKNATKMKSFADPDGAHYSALEGAWRGKLNDTNTDVELIAWSPYPSGTAMPAMAYIPKYDCLMSALFSAKKATSHKPNVAYLEFRMYSPNWRTDNCAAMVKYDRGNEIHQFTARGFVKFDVPANTFEFTPSNTKLGAITPQKCENLEMAFSKSKVSDAFYDVLQQHAHPDKRGPKLTPAFLQSQRE